MRAIMSPCKIANADLLNCYGFDFRAYGRGFSFHVSLHRAGLSMGLTHSSFWITYTFPNHLNLLAIARNSGSKTPSGKKLQKIDGCRNNGNKKV